MQFFQINPIQVQGLESSQLRRWRGDDVRRYQWCSKVDSRADDARQSVALECSSLDGFLIFIVVHAFLTSLRLDARI